MGTQTHQDCNLIEDGPLVHMKVDILTQRGAMGQQASRRSLPPAEETEEAPYELRSIRCSEPRPILTNVRNKTCEVQWQTIMCNGR